MAQIEKDGIYKDDAQHPNFFQFRKGQEVGDVEYTYVEAFPDPVDPRTGQKLEADEYKAEDAPASKAQTAPENKKS